MNTGKNTRDRSNERKVVLTLALTGMLAIAAFCVMSPIIASTDGKIVFVKRDGFDYQIYAVKPDGTEQTQLTNGPGGRARPSFNPDGTRIVFD